ncbi:NAD(P)-binding protein [Synechococcales cyanobacterium C]|uniref:NAD(P)-binding protein n=2 Tax=Petrachloros TaxID=2918834 RepID=A0A8K2A797_9CYAN|nr:NAD(P)-binding protein [Petrachloros mirabilis ULC683]
MGGGLAGLSAAYHLKKLGISATVYEAKPILGGRIRSQDALIPGLINDLGGTLINSDHEDMLALIEELDLTLFDRFAAFAEREIPVDFYHLAGQSRSEAEVAELLGPIAEQIGEDFELLEQDFDTHVQRLDALSVAEYLDQHTDKISVDWIRTLLELGIRSEYGVEPAESSALQLIYNLPSVDGEKVTAIKSDEAYMLQGGSAVLIEALATELSEQIKTRWILRQISSEGDKFTLMFDQRGSQEMVQADYVILALPFPALRRVDLQVDLPDGLRRFIKEVDLGKNEKLFAGFESRVWEVESGFMGMAWSDGSFCNIWDDTSRQPESSKGVLTFFLSADQVQAASARAKDQGALFVSELDRWIPEVDIAQAQTNQYLRTRWAQDPFIGGGYTSFKPGQYVEFSDYLYIDSEDPDERVDVHVGSLVFAGEQFSDEHYGYMEGAAQTGRLSAEVVAGLIHGISDTTAVNLSVFNIDNLGDFLLGVVR